MKQLHESTKIVTATNVEADPIGVRLPPRLAPKITDHHRREPSGAPRSCRILASMATSGMLSVTLLNAARRSPGLQREFLVIPDRDR